MRIKYGMAECLPTIPTDTGRYWRWCYSGTRGCGLCIFSRLRFDMDVNKISGGTVLFLDKEEEVWL